LSFEQIYQEIINDFDSQADSVTIQKFVKLATFKASTMNSLAILIYRINIISDLFGESSCEATYKLTEVSKF
jgi:hypothetical protein